MYIIVADCKMFLYHCYCGGKKMGMDTWITDVSLAMIFKDFDDAHDYLKGMNINENSFLAGNYILRVYEYEHLSRLGANRCI